VVHQTKIETSSHLRGSLTRLQQRMRLDVNLEKCVCLMSQDLFDMDDFPWVKGLREWHAQTIVPGRTCT
jgi:hypothetical protein